MCASLQTVHILSLVLAIHVNAFDGCDRRWLELEFPQEIIEFMSINKNDWWKRCNIHNQVLAISYLQTGNVLARLSSMQSLS